MPLQYRSKLLQTPHRVIKLDKLNEKQKISPYLLINIQLSILKIYILKTYMKIIVLYRCLVDSVTDIYPDVVRNSYPVLSYFFDRLSFSDRCGLLYSYIVDYKLGDITEHDKMNDIVSKYVIYKSTTSEQYYFGEEHTKMKSIAKFDFI